MYILLEVVDKDRSCLEQHMGNNPLVEYMIGISLEVGMGRRSMVLLDN
jgi:hypothetical protein